MSDVLTEAVERFMDAVETRLSAMNQAIADNRAAALAVQGPAGPQGEPGPAGERGADGQVPEEEMQRRVGAAVAEHMRTFYRGVFAEDDEYRMGQAVTHDGSLWIALRDAPGKPGDDGWQLAVKRGRDARR